MHPSKASSALQPLDRRRATFGLLLIAVVYYSLLLTDGHSPFGASGLVTRPDGGLNLVFNSMVRHLLEGRFDVDPAIVAQEGFIEHERVVAYWGILFAVLRLPLCLWSDGLNLDVTRLSMLVAAVTALAFKLRTLNVVLVRVPPRSASLLYWLVAFTLAFSGAQIEFLKVSLYQEVCLWAGTLGAIFVYLAIVGLQTGAFKGGRFCWLAVVAGLALLSRVSTGVALYAATALLILATAIMSRNLDTPGNPRRLVYSVLVPLAILACFASVTGLVNYERWGNPLVFADYQHYIENLRHPERLQRMADYGLFNFVRLPYSVMYYFFPVWVLRSDAHHLYLDEAMTRLFDFTQLPPSTFFLTDALLVGCFVYLAWFFVQPRSMNALTRTQIAVTAAGLSAGGLLMLTAVSVSFRYRIEFYPLLEFGAFLGIAALTDSSRRNLRRPVVYCLGVGALISILASHGELILYKLSEKPGISLADSGIWIFYGDRLQALRAKIH